MMRNLQQRDLRPEIMDQPGVERRRHEHALRGLARVNALSRIAAGTWRPIGDLAARRGLRKMSICDLACGGGDVSLGLVRRAQAAGIDARLTGYDLSPTAIEHARRQAEKESLPADFVMRDLFAEPPEGPYDVAVCTLFLHHLDDARAVDLLSLMRRIARRLVVVNDLLRKPLGYAAAQVVCRMISTSDIVRLDGPQSVAAAFSLDEARRLAESAGLRHANLRRTWPFRFLLDWEYPAEQSTATGMSDGPAD